MMHAKQEPEVQIFYARIAGFVYLLLIVMFMSGNYIFSYILGDGNFATRAQNAYAAARLYRIGLALQVMTSVCTVLLAYALYVVLKPANQRLAHLALLFRLGEALVGTFTMLFAYSQLKIYTSVGSNSGLGLEQWQALLTLARGSGFVGFNMSILFFSFGSILFFTVFLKSGYLPKVQAVLGIFASVLVVFAGLAGLILPEYAEGIQFLWMPMFVSEIVTGCWLLWRGVTVRAV